MASRIYKVTTPLGVRLIDALVKQNAIAFVAREQITAEVATGHDIAELVGAGIKVERTTAPSNNELFEGQAA